MTTRSDATQRAINLFREPEFLEELCDLIAEGMTLYDFTLSKNIRYKQTFQWIQSDEDRQKSYETAIEARNAVMSDVVLSGVLTVAQQSAKKLYNDDGTPVAISKMDDRTAASVSGVEVSYDMSGRIASRRIKTYDKLRALEMLGRNQRMFTDKMELAGALRLEDLVTQSMKKPDNVNT
jgi:hypothetical protein